MEKGLGHLFITLESSSHFFYKTDFKQYLFKQCSALLTTYALLQPVLKL